MDITVTVPLESTALRSMALQLEELAGTLDRVVPGGLEAVEGPGAETQIAEPSIPPFTPEAAVLPPPPIPAPPQPEVAADTELDARGLPWDPRINGAGTIRKKKDGNWKIKRGVSKELVTQVKAELRAVFPLIAGKDHIPEDTAPVTPPQPEAVAPAAPTPAAAATPPQPAAAAVKPIDYAGFMQGMQAFFNAGTLTVNVLMDEIKVVAAPRGVNIKTLPELAHHPMVLPQLLVNIQNRIALGTGVVQ